MIIRTSFGSFRGHSERYRGKFRSVRIKAKDINTRLMGFPGLPLLLFIKLVHIRKKWCISQDIFSIGYIILIINTISSTYSDMCTLHETMISEDWLPITNGLGTDIKNMLIRNGMNPGLCPQPPREISIINEPIRLPRMPSLLYWFAAVCKLLMYWCVCMVF